MIAAAAVLFTAAFIISVIAGIGMAVAWNRPPRRESHSEAAHRIDAEAASYHGSDAWGR